MNGSVGNTGGSFADGSGGDVLLVQVLITCQECTSLAPSASGVIIIGQPAGIRG